MKKYLAVILMGIIGCTASAQKSVQTVLENYETVKFEDGINFDEAKVIAQRALIKQNMADIYDIENPKLVVRDVEELPNYEQYWFISFKEKKMSSIEYIFMAIINRENGKVKFADDYQEDKRWIIEAALLQ